MKQLTCEMCGSAELIKEDGVFVCQGCGCKYSVEEAKKMMADSTTDGGGISKHGNEDKLKNLYEMARRYRDDNNSESATKCYEQILLEDTNSYEAYFYSVYFKAMSCKIGQIGHAADSISNALGSVFAMMENSNVTNEEKTRFALEMIVRLNSIADMLSNGALNHYFGIDSSIQYQYKYETAIRILSVANIYFILGDELEKHFSNDKAMYETIVAVWKNGIALLDSSESRLRHTFELNKKYEKKSFDFELEYIIDEGNWRDYTIKKLNDKKYQQVLLLLDKVDVQEDDEIFWNLSKFILHSYWFILENLNYHKEIMADCCNIIKNKIKIGCTYGNDGEKIKELLAVKDINGSIILMSAVEELDVEWVNVLVKLGADIHNKYRGYTAIEIITKRKKFYTDEDTRKGLDIVKILVEAGADTSTVLTSNTNTDIADFIKTKNPDAQTVSGGCYVATAVYGSYDCPEVWTLRRFRDYTLAETWYGRAFIRTYYAISPTIVKWFGKTEWFKKMWKGKLDRMVSNLQNNGVKNTPYEDKEW